MSNKKNKTQIITGLFVTIGLLILVVGIFTLGGQKKSFINSMELAAVFDDVNGLQEGNNVFFSGVKIGTVKKVGFSGSSRVRVMFHIDKKVHDFIHKDAKV